MRLRSILIVCLGLLCAVPVITAPARAQAEDVDPQDTQWRTVVATFLAGLSPARQAAIGRIADGLARDA